MPPDFDVFFIKDVLYFVNPLAKLEIRPFTIMVTNILSGRSVQHQRLSEALADWNSRHPVTALTPLDVKRQAAEYPRITLASARKYVELRYP